MCNLGKIDFDDLLIYIRDYLYIKWEEEKQYDYESLIKNDLPWDIMKFIHLSPAQNMQAVGVYTNRSKNEAFANMLDKLIKEHGNLSDPEIYKRANLNRDTFWRIRKNGDTKNRDWVIAIAFAIGLSELETRRLLSSCTQKRKELTKEEKDREALFMWFIQKRDEGIVHSHKVSEINDWILGEFKDETGKKIKLLGNGSPEE